MFGYVRIDKPELKVREYESYRGAYCGLCRSMGKCTGCASRMTLSYDFAFLLLIRAVLTRTKCELSLQRCFVHPLKKRPMMKHNTESEYVACAAALLSYYKCRDDLQDETGKKKLRARLFHPTAKGMRKKALKKHPELIPLDDTLRETMDRIASEEKKGVPSADFYAALSGGLLGEIFAFGLEKPQQQIARTLGRHVGKWIYLVDAYDDLTDDLKHGRFNPYSLIWSAESSGESPVTAERREMIRIALLSELSEAEKALDLIDFSGYKDYEGILKNILYLGLPNTAQAILCPCDHKKNDKRNKQKGNE